MLNFGVIVVVVVCMALATFVGGFFGARFENYWLAALIAAVVLEFVSFCMKLGDSVASKEDENTTKENK